MSGLSRALGRPVLLPLLAALALGCQSKEERLAEHLERAESYIESERSKEALIELRNALQLDPQSAELNFRIAELLREEGNPSDAAFYYREALRLAPERSDAALALAKLLVGNETGEAKELVKGVLEREPENPLAHVVRSEVALGENDVEQALESAREAVSLDPDWNLAHLHLGVTHRALLRARRLGVEGVPEAVSFERALAALDRGIELSEEDPEAGPVWRARAWLERALLLAGWEERSDEAPEAFRRAVEAAEPSRDALERALQAVLDYARRSGNRELARWALERRVEADPGRLAAWRALAAMAQREDGSGLAVLRRLLEQRPEDARAHALYGRRLVRWESAEAAVEHLSGVAAETDEPERAWATVVEIQGNRGDVEGARAALEPMRRDYPDAPQTHFAEAYVAFLDGDMREAAERLRGLSGSTESVRVQSLLAQAELRLGRTDAALAALNRAWELVEGPAPRLLRLESRAHIAAGSWPDALRTLQRLRRANDGSLGMDEALSLVRALYRTDRPDAARRVLGKLLERDDAPVEAALLFAREERDREPERAREVLEEARERYPEDARVVERLARLDLAAGRREAALERLDAALSEDPEAVPLRLLRARVRAARGELDAALADARLALEQAPDQAETASLLVQLLARTEGVEAALETLEAEQRAGTLGTPGRLLLARLHLRRDENARAIELLEQVVAEEPERSGAKNDLAYLLADRGEDLARARELAQEARSALPNAHAVADTLGFVLLRQGLARPALEQFRAAASLAESSEAGEIPPAYHYHRGLALKALERSEDAAKAFEEALAVSEDFRDAAEVRRELAALRSQT